MYVSGTYAPGAFGGSELCARTLLKRLAHRHGVKVLAATDGKYQSGIVDGLEIAGVGHHSRFAEVRELAERFLPDVIFTQPWWHDVAACVGRDLNIPAVLRVVDWPIPQTFFNGVGSSLSGVVVMTREAETAIGSLGFQTIRLPAFIELSRAQSRAQAELSRRFITMFNPIRPKGGFLFLSIAGRMTDKQFAVVPGWSSLRNAKGEFDQEVFRRSAESHGVKYDGWLPDEAQFSSLSNVTVLRPREAVEEIYDQSRIVLVPSLWKEQFGRVIFEGAANGAVVIASGMPSLRENAGDAAAYVSDFRNADAWIARIMEFDSPTLFEDQRKKGHEYVIKTYDLDRVVGQLYSWMCTIAGL